MPNNTNSSNNNKRVSNIKGHPRLKRQLQKIRPKLSRKLFKQLESMKVIPQKSIIKKKRSQYDDIFIEDSMIIAEQFTGATENLFNKLGKTVSQPTKKQYEQNFQTLKLLKKIAKSHNQLHKFEKIMGDDEYYYFLKYFIQNNSTDLTNEKPKVFNNSSLSARIFQEQEKQQNIFKDIDGWEMGPNQLFDQSEMIQPISFNSHFYQMSSQFIPSSRMNGILQPPSQGNYSLIFNDQSMQGKFSNEY